jgi:DNA-binding GntR family transcriptional regulator
MSKIENKVLSDLVYEKIKYMIDEGVLVAGQKINKVELAEKLGVSQTPINDALSKLVGEKFIGQISRQGFFVRDYSNYELSYLFEVRASLEGMAIRLCVERADAELLNQLINAFAGFSFPIPEEQAGDYFRADKLFHENIINFSGNPFLFDLARTSGYLIKSNQKGLVRSPNETWSEHQAVIDAIIGRDAVKAQEHLIRHLLISRDRLRSIPD